MGQENKELERIIGVGTETQRTSAGYERSFGDAQSDGLKKMVENSCISCSRTLRPAEIKILPPKYIQERDEYVKAGTVSKRLMCVQCYNTLKSVTKTQVKYRDTPTSRRSYLLKSVIHNLLLKG